MTNRRPTIELKAAESSAIKETIERAKHAEREGRWSDACAIYEQLVRDPAANANTRLAALRWLGRAYLEQGNRGAALDVLEAAVASADTVGSPPAVAQALNVIGIVYQMSGDLTRPRPTISRPRKEVGRRRRLSLMTIDLGRRDLRGDLRAGFEHSVGPAGYSALAWQSRTRF